MISTNKLNYKAPEKCYATEELVDYRIIKTLPTSWNVRVFVFGRTLTGVLLTFEVRTTYS